MDDSRNAGAASPPTEVDAVDSGLVLPQQQPLPPSGPISAATQSVLLGIVVFPLLTVFLFWVFGEFASGLGWKGEGRGTGFFSFGMPVLKGLLSIVYLPLALAAGVAGLMAASFFASFSVTGWARDMTSPEIREDAPIATQLSALVAGVAMVAIHHILFHWHAGVIAPTARWSGGPGFGWFTFQYCCSSGVTVTVICLGLAGAFIGSILPHDRIVSFLGTPGPPLVSERGKSDED